MVIATGTAILGAAALTAAGTAFSARQAGKAGRAHAEAGTEAARMQAEQFAQTRADLAPWREAGGGALQEYSAQLGLGGEAADFKTTPGYEFRLAEGQKAVERSKLAQGLGQSGAMVKATLRFGEGLASQEYQNYLSRLSGLAGMGLGAAGTTGAFGTEAARTGGGFLAGAGAARASGFLNVGGAVSEGLSGMAGLLGYGTSGSTTGTATGNIPNYAARTKPPVPGSYYG